MVIDTGSPTPFLLIGAAHPLHIAIVIVHPYERDVVRHFETILIDVHRFFVRHKNLRNLVSRFSDMFFQQLPLLINDVGDEWHPLLHRQVAFESLVVDATHRHGIDILILRSLTQPVVPFLPNGLSVGFVVPFPITL